MNEEQAPHEALGLSERQCLCLVICLIISSPLLVVGAPFIAAALMFVGVAWVVGKAGNSA